MKRAFQRIGLVGAIAVGSLLVSTSRAQDGQNHGNGPRGGVLERTGHYHFEVVLTTVGVRVYAYGMDGKPLDAAGLSGTVTFYHPNSARPWFNRPLSATGQSKISLDCAINLSKVPASGAKAAFEISGLPDPAEPSASFTVPFTLSQVAPAATIRPAPVPAAITYAVASRADQPAIQAQRVCAVTGNSLGSMGTPLKVTRGDRSVFLCCQSCLARVMANPDQYFGAVR